ncbi:RHS repeat domain-containing protein [Xanthomonas arboricola]|uniref:RHS repeat domain-containing protein n=1 Tax=Xanthomonas arboricola TaxID=56448 RepID=UPI001AF625B7|nr:RHS repeat-associated core domain-containing protein [Xanthomonas arboricola]CAD7387235.1 hypothetical protein X12_004213 [Xanthomonas arboricola]CAG2098147.1 hypothetical protein XCY_004217 [Xanthomonas arboricola pv. juglandis]
MSRVKKLFANLLLAITLASVNLGLCGSVSAQTVRYVHTDGLSSVSVLTDENRNILERREYEPYGAMLTATLDGPGYTGHVMDSETNLIYMQQRYFDPKIGQFLSVDPVGTGVTSGARFNRYRYADSNPYSSVDPDGRLTTNGKIDIPPPPPTTLQPVRVIAPTQSTGAAISNIAGITVTAPFMETIPRPIPMALPWISAGVGATILGPALLIFPAEPCGGQRCGEISGARSKMVDVPDFGQPGQWIDGRRKSRLYGPDGRPRVDIDKPHQGAPYPHVHEWENGVREHPGREIPDLPGPQQD